MTPARTKKRTVFLAVCGESDRSFETYSEACEWLDRISPSTANCGFTTEDHGHDEEIKTVIVRHA